MVDAVAGQIVPDQGSTVTRLYDEVFPSEGRREDKIERHPIAVDQVPLIDAEVHFPQVQRQLLLRKRIGQREQPAHRLA